MGLARKELREDLAAAIRDTLSVAAVFESRTKITKGISPVITVESGPSRPSHTPTEPHWVGISLLVCVRRDDADTAEDELDTLTDALIDLLNERYNVEWMNPTEPDYEMLDGHPYRLEWHDLSIEWWEA